MDKVNPMVGQVRGLAGRVTLETIDWYALHSPHGSFLCRWEDGTMEVIEKDTVTALPFVSGRTVPETNEEECARREKREKSLAPSGANQAAWHCAIDAAGAVAISHAVEHQQRLIIARAAVSAYCEAASR